MTAAGVGEAAVMQPASGAVHRPQIGHAQADAWYAE